MPRDLVFVRHGKSEGNKARDIWEEGSEDPFTDEFLDRHSANFRLTDEGQKQAAVTGQWIIENIGPAFDFYGTSDYVRAKETAGRLALPDARWEKDIDLRERDHGFSDLQHPDQKKLEYAKELERYKKNPFLYPAPGGGESMALMRLRSSRIFNRLRRRVSTGKAILVSHGEFMWGCRADIEHITMDKYLEIRKSNNPFNKILNCQVLHYTRVNPFTGEESAYYTWMRSVCPSAMHLSSNIWTPIIRSKSTNEELIAEAEAYPRYIK